MRKSKRPSRTRRTGPSSPPPRRRHRKKSRRRSLLGFLFKIGLACLILWTGVGIFYYLWALTFDLSKIGEMEERSAVFDRNGAYYSRLAGENRVVVPFDKVSNHFINALITREDTRYYSHRGIDPIGIARAAVRNLLMGGIRQGASTITQQLARNSYPLGGRNFHRKLLEAALAFRIETELSKEKILELYMNRIYFGSGYYGIETASQAYFGKPASRLNLSESALLAGLIRSPNRLSPFNNLEASLKQRDIVLNRMYEVGFITAEQKAAAEATEIRLAPRRSGAPQDNWAMDMIVRELELVLTREQLQEGGLRIYTTIDPALQNDAESVVKRHLEAIEKLPNYPHPARSDTPSDQEFDLGTPYLQGALIAIDNRSGAIRAIVGGRAYEHSKFNRALFGTRQIGSAVKPFIYATALEAGLDPETLISDDRIQPGEIPRKYGNYNPANADGKYEGLRPLSDGLIYSRNTMSVRVALRTGIDRIVDRLALLNLSDNIPRYPSVALGTFETSLKDLTAAYTVFATGGNRLQPYIIDHIVDASGRTIFKATKGSIRVFSPQAVSLALPMLKSVITRGTAARARALGLSCVAAGKTGTTNSYYDAWFIGLTEGLSCGVWVGFDTPRTIMKEGYGSTLALPIWVSFIQSPAAQTYPHGDF